MLQVLHSYLKLSNGLITGFPKYDDELVLTKQNQKFFLEEFSKGQEISISAKVKIEKQKIEDIYFCYYKNEIDDEKVAYLKLRNGYFITEINYGPIGLPIIGLLILDKNSFLNRVNELEEDIKSFQNDIKNSQ